jgi:GTP-binding protein
MPKVTSLRFRDTHINIVDTPSRADFGRDAERALKIADGVMLVVDGVEGPLPQTRFVLRRALEADLAPIVVVTKIDLPHARPSEVLEEVRELFVDLDASEEQLRFPALYCNALHGVCREEPDGSEQSLLPLFELILNGVPAPVHDSQSGLQLLVTMLDYDDFLGRLALGRVFRGTLHSNQVIAHCRLDGSTGSRASAGLYGFEGLRRIEIDQAGPGDIVAVSGLEAARIGETLSDPDNPEPLPPLEVDEPTIALVLSVNDSPMAGLDGQHVSGRSLRERLWREILTNVAIRVEETDSPDAFELCGRDELQLAILIEMMRREGFELQVSRPKVLTREEAGRGLEPMELLVVDCPEDFSGG